MSNTCLCYCLDFFAGIMGDFAWRPFVKQVGPVGETVPSFAATPFAREGGSTCWRSWPFCYCY